MQSRGEYVPKSKLLGNLGGIVKCRSPGAVEREDPCRFRWG